MFWLPLPATLEAPQQALCGKGCCPKQVRGRNSGAAPSSSLRAGCFCWDVLHLGVTCTPRGGRQLPTGPLVGGAYSVL